MELFSPDDIVDMSAYVDDCRCQCRQHLTVQDGLLHLHGRPIFDRLLVRGDLILPGDQEIRRLPDLLAVSGLVNLTDCSKLHVMPSQMFASRIFLSGTDIRELPASLIADQLDVSGCPNIEEIPAGVKARIFRGANCPKLERVAPGLEFASLDVSGSRVVELPADLTVTYELKLRGCSRLAIVNEGANVRGSIDVRGCDMLFTLPRSVQPAIAITDGMLIHNDEIVVAKMSAEEAAMCLGVKAIAAFPHRHFKNLDQMQKPVVAVEREGKGTCRGRAVAALGARVARSDRGAAIFREWVARLDEQLQLPGRSEPKLLK
jgi:hypothetical protein